MTTEIIKREPVAVTVGDARAELTVDDLVRQVDLIREAMSRVMREGIHYGKVPGAEKPSLWKPGAEVLCMLFRLAPEMTIVRSVETKEEITFVVRCDLVKMATGSAYGSGVGSCSSREKKYGTREAKRKCPTCGRETIYVSKKEPGFYCYGKVGGCGANYRPNDPRITSQAVGTIPNPDIWEQHNTILKMAQKRAHVAAVLSCTGASDSFTQDMEDKTGEPEPDAPTEPNKPAAQTSGPAPKAEPRAEPVQPVANPAGATMKQIRFFNRLCDELGVSEADATRRAGEILGWAHLASVEDLSSAELSRVLDAMKTATEQSGGAD